MGLVTDTMQWHEKWCNSLFYLEFANNLCPLGKEEDLSTPQVPKLNPITWLWAVSRRVGVQGPGSALVPPHGTGSLQLSAFSLDAVAADRLVSLSHSSTHFYVLLKTVNVTAPGTQASYEG